MKTRFSKAIGAASLGLGFASVFAGAPVFAGTAPLGVTPCVAPSRLPRIGRPAGSVEQDGGNSIYWIEQKATASDAGPDQGFGQSVSISGSRALVGGGNAAYVLEYAGGVWQQTAKLTASDGNPGDYFGHSVALDGDVAVVGAPLATVNGHQFQGAAYVFRYAGGSWTQEAKLTAAEGLAGDYFGDSVAIYGNTALVGADRATIDGNTYQGAAYVFGDTNGSWSEDQQLLSSDGPSQNFFGAAVALENGSALISAPGVDNDVGGPGKVYAFMDTNGTWAQTQDFSASSTDADAFGEAISLDGDTALIGANSATIGGHYLEGAAYIYSSAGGSWAKMQRLTEPDGQDEDDFGVAVGLNGGTAVVGQYSWLIAGNPPGAAYVFTAQGGAWSLTRKLTASDATDCNWFGYAVAVDTQAALSGALGAVVDGNYDGAAYFYGRAALVLTASAPGSVAAGAQYLDQATLNNAAATASPAVAVVLPVPAGATYVSAEATQGGCAHLGDRVTCLFGQVAGGGGAATANLTLQATGGAGEAIRNSAGLAKATPPLTAGATTTIGGCPDGYAAYDGTLEPDGTFRAPPYTAPAGQESAILTADADFRIYLRYTHEGTSQVYRIPGHEIHRGGPAGTYEWGVKAGAAGGTYLFCIAHP